MLDKITNFKEFLYKDKRSFMLAFNDDEERVNKYILGVVNTITNNPDLLKCTSESLRDAAITSAVLNIPLDARQYAWLVPYGNKAQFQLSYKGYVHIAKRDRDVDNIISVLVYEKDDFSFDIGSNTIHHIPNLDDNGYGKDESIKYAYAVVRFRHNTGRSPMFEVMTRNQIDKIKSKAKQQYIWGPHYGEMARKTVIKRVCKHGQLGDVARYDEIDNSIENDKIINVTPSGELSVTNDDLASKDQIIKDVEGCKTEEELRLIQAKHQDTVMEFSLYNVKYSKEISKSMGTKEDAIYIERIEESLKSCEDIESIDKVYNAHTVRINRLKSRDRNAVETVYCEYKEFLTNQKED